MRRYKLTVTTASDGTATAYTPRVSGKIHSVQYVKDGTIRLHGRRRLRGDRRATGENIWTQADVNASAVCTRAPRPIPRPASPRSTPPPARR
jgi:hypothetical protein